MNATAKRTGALAALVALLMAGGAAHAEDGVALAAARAAVKDLGTSLKEQLVAALKAGGPVSAIGVCKTVGQDLAKDASHKHALTIRRTALRVRNPANAPDDFERKALEDFTAKIAAGADPASLEHAESVTSDGRTVVRYMKAIPTAAEPCLACHGGSLAPEVASAIKASYPDDQATGFKAGELRGAFSVTIERN